MPTEASLSSSYIKTASQKFTPYDWAAPSMWRSTIWNERPTTLRGFWRRSNEPGRSHEEKSMRGSRENQGLDSLRSIHKDCKTTYKAPLVQLINKEVSGGCLEAVTLSDGLSVSPNVDPLNEEMADELNQIPLFDFLVINNAFVKGDRITLSDFEHKRIQTNGRVHLLISGPLTGPSVRGGR